MRSDNEIDIQKLKSLAESLSKAFKLKLVVLFGSAARGKMRPDSDIDIGIVTESRVFEDPSLYSDFMAALEKIEHEIKRGVDCVEINSWNIVLLSQILREGIVLYEHVRGFHSIQKLHWRFLVEDNRKYTLNYPKILRRKLEAL
jgi:uncharacterized protein